MAQNQEKKSAKKPTSAKKAPQKSKTAKGERPNHTSKKSIAKKGSPLPAPQKQSKKAAGAPKSKLRVIPLGGLQEIGKNMTVLEYGQDIIVIDCGVAFPDDDLLGVDLVIPDTSYLEQNEHRIRGIFLTHGHEDHIGSLPYVLQKLRVPVYGT
ncbi:MAG: MBL fold metallo-hydrolase, partial [Clostridia bacterium]|nr:MBL fold metallo-hydrolase [Clostridia bacterium]